MRRINIRFRLQHDSVPHAAPGGRAQLSSSCSGPQIASQMREVIAQYTAEQVYSTARQEIQDKIRELALERLSHKMMEREKPRDASYNVAMRDTIILYDTLLLRHRAAADRWSMRSTARPSSTTSPRNTSFASSARSAKSERKKIEAEGIREFQQIVSPGHLRFLPALARRRGDASAGAVQQLEGRDHRRRQRRPADHPRQCG